MAGAVELIGAVLAAAGLALGLWAAASLWRAPVLALPNGGRAPVLVEHGPYAFSRHPMYLGTVLVLSGMALWMTTPALLVAAFAGGVLLDRQVLPGEEARLLARHGGWYSDYAREVPRWF